MRSIKPNTVTGKYLCLRSSESRDAMIGWSGIEYDKTSGRWYEMWTQKFSDYREAEDQQKSEEMEIRGTTFDHIEADVRQSVLEMFYGKKPNDTTHMHIKLEEIGPHEVWCFEFGIKRADQKQREKLINIVRKWHATGKIKMRDLKTIGCYISWDKA